MDRSYATVALVPYNIANMFDVQYISKPEAVTRYFIDISTTLHNEINLIPIHHCLQLMCDKSNWYLGVCNFSAFSRWAAQAIYRISMINLTYHFGDTVEKLQIEG